jgi:23S rRNA pseudouridine1911/1915/1917 synthase
MRDQVSGDFKLLTTGVLQAALEVKDLLARRDPNKSRVLYHRVSYITTQVASLQKVSMDLALRKPAGLHTVRVSGGCPENLEEFLALHWADLWRARQPRAPVPPLPRLVTRLDRETSGLVLALADASPAAEAAFRAQEREGRVEKSYLGLIHGELRAPLLIRAGLETRGRRRAKVLPLPDPDAARHTGVIPLRLLDGAFLRQKGVWGQGGADSPLKRPLTLIQARILRGSRHQIRAHLAGAGFPLVGDPLYGEAGDGAGRLFLHHAAVSLPGFFVLDMPGWGVGEESVVFSPRRAGGDPLSAPGF